MVTSLGGLLFILFLLLMTNALACIGFVQLLSRSRLVRVDIALRLILGGLFLFPFILDFPPRLEEPPFWEAVAAAIFIGIMELVLIRRIRRFGFGFASSEPGDAILALEAAQEVTGLRGVISDGPRRASRLAPLVISKPARWRGGGVSIYPPADSSMRKRLVETFAGRYQTIPLLQHRPLIGWLLCAAGIIL